MKIYKNNYVGTRKYLNFFYIIFCYVSKLFQHLKNIIIFNNCLKLIVYLINNKIVRKKFSLHRHLGTMNFK